MKNTKLSLFLVLKAYSRLCEHGQPPWPSGCEVEVICAPKPLVGGKKMLVAVLYCPKIASEGFAIYRDAASFHPHISTEKSLDWERKISNKAPGRATEEGCGPRAQVNIGQYRWGPVKVQQRLCMSRLSDAAILHLQCNVYQLFFRS